jgi:hypothetical protein
MNMGALALFVSSFVTRPRWVNVASFLIFALAVVMQTMFAATVRPGVGSSPWPFPFLLWSVLMEWDKYCVLTRRRMCALPLVLLVMCWLAVCRCILMCPLPPSPFPTHTTCLHSQGLHDIMYNPQLPVIVPILLFPMPWFHYGRVFQDILEVTQPAVGEVCVTVGGGVMCAGL